MLGMLMPGDPIAIERARPAGCAGEGEIDEHGGCGGEEGDTPLRQLLHPVENRHLCQNLSRDHKCPGRNHGAALSPGEMRDPRFSRCKQKLPSRGDARRGVHEEAPLGPFLNRKTRQLASQLNSSAHITRTRPQDQQEAPTTGPCGSLNGDTGRATPSSFWITGTSGDDQSLQILQHGGVAPLQTRESVSGELSPSRPPKQGSDRCQTAHRQSGSASFPRSPTRSGSSCQSGQTPRGEADSRAPCARHEQRAVLLRADERLAPRGGRWRWASMRFRPSNFKDGRGARNEVFRHRRSRKVPKGHRFTEKCSERHTPNVIRL